MFPFLSDEELNDVVPHSERSQHLQKGVAKLLEDCLEIPEQDRFNPDTCRPYFIACAAFVTVLVEYGKSRLRDIEEARTSN